MQDELFRLPVIDFEAMEERFPPEEYETYVAITYTKLNRVRRRLYHACKEKGYRCASYISPHAFVWHNAEIGENTFIFENSIIQYCAKISNNVVVWSGCHIGHRTAVESDCWLAPCVAVSGFCHIGSGSFIGVNASVGDNVRIEKDTVLGAGTVVVKSLKDSGRVYIGTPAKSLPRTSYEQFSINEEM